MGTYILIMIANTRKITILLEKKINMHTFAKELYKFVEVALKKSLSAFSNYRFANKNH